MHFLSIAIASFLLSGITSANSLNLLNDFSKRQDAFVPGSTPVDSCSDGWLSCGPRDCILPTRGDVCCSEGYGCPSGSFCLTQGFCCPDGEDASTCAVNNDVTLTAGFNTDPISASTQAPASSSASCAASLMTTPTSATGAPTYAVPSSTVPSDTVSVGGASVTSVGTQNYTTASKTGVQPFLGAGSKGQDGSIGLVGVLAGAVAGFLL